MGDLLIRNLDNALKRELQDLAKENGRSLSEEAIMHLRRSLTMSDERSRKAGDWLRGLLGEERWSEEELTAIELARHEPDRAPPGFEE